MLNAVVCGAINHLLKTSSWALVRLRGFSGSVLAIEGTPFPIRLRIHEEGYFSAAEPEELPAVTISLPQDAVARLLADRSSLFSSIRISGAADLAETLGFVFRNLEWDAEGDLAGLIGDIPARRLALTGQGLANGLRNSAERGLENLREYAVEERRVVAANDEIVAFGEAVDVLRHDLSRLEKRIDSL